MILLQTERLILRKYNLGDAAFVFELLNTPAWKANIGDRNIRSIKDAETYIQEKYLSLYEDGIGSYVIELKGDTVIVGSCGLYQRPNLDHPDIGFALLPQFEKKGYAFEASSALMDYASEHEGVTVVYGITVPKNANSIRLLNKLGLMQKGTVFLENDDTELLLFSNEAS